MLLQQEGVAEDLTGSLLAPISWDLIFTSRDFPLLVA